MIISLTGTCRHCGQIQTVNCDDFLTPTQVDELASENCTCAGAAEARFERKLENSVRFALGEDCQARGMDYALDPEAQDFARQAARRIYAGDIDRAQFIERHGDTVRIEEKDGQVVIVRAHKKQIRM